MRTKKALFNSAANIAAGIAQLVPRFVVRFFIIRYIGMEYLGLDGLFANILTYLSLAELGFGFAIGTMLYKPLADGNNDRIRTLVRFCRKVYTIIGFVIIAMGLLVLPFIQFFINDTQIDMSLIRIYFALFLVSSSITYFNFHKTTLIACDQKGYIQRFFAGAVSLITSAINIVLIIAVGDYIFVLLVILIGNVLQNILLAMLVSKMYPFLRGKNVLPLDKDDKKHIKKSIFALLLHNLGFVFIFATDSIMVSAFFGLVYVGIYTNYTLILTTVKGFAVKVISGASAGIGNLWTTEPIEKVFGIFKRYQWLVFVIFSASSIIIFSVVQPFIAWYAKGSENLLGIPVVAVLCVNFFLNGFRTSVNSFKDVKGLFYQDRYKPLLEIAISLAASLILLYFFGLIGIFLGTLISTLAVCVWIEPYVLYKHGFKKSVKGYFPSYFGFLLLYLCTGAAAFIATYYLGMGLIGFILRGLVSTAMVSVVYLAVFFRNKEFRFYVALAKNMLKKLKRRKIEKTEEL